MKEVSVTISLVTHILRIDLSFLMVCISLIIVLRLIAKLFYFIEGTLLTHVQVHIQLCIPKSLSQKAMECLCTLLVTDPGAML